MKYKYLYQNSNEENKIYYDFIENEKIQVTYHGKTDIFNFLGMPDGEVYEINTTLDINPIMVAKRENGVLFVELLKRYTDEEREQIESNLTELEAWQEV